MYENIKNSKFLSIDIETYDPNLKEMGPGVYRSVPLDFLNENGFILGVSITNEDGIKAYYNLGHYDCTEELRKKNIEYLRETLATDSIKIGQRLNYDLDWLENWLFIKVNGPLIDISIAEALLDENQKHYTLDFMGMKYFNVGKMIDEIQNFCIINELKGDPRKWLWKMPYYIVEKYAIQDVDLPIKIWFIQEQELIKQELIDLMHLECELIRVLMIMRKNGTIIDIKTRDKNANILKERVKNTYNKLTAQLGYNFNYNSTQQLALIFDGFEIPYPITDKGNPSIKREYLQKLAKGQVKDFKDEFITDEIKLKLGEDLSDLRRADKVLETFIAGSLVRFITKGNLIHTSFYNMLTDEYGTRSGRFSSANPNLQQIPSIGVDEYYGRLSREPFIPLPDCKWGKLDYSQIEYRFMAHFAKGPGSEEVRAKYNENPRQDYHQYIVDLTGLKRRYAKNLNFGIAYGMGARHMAEFFQWDLDYCYDILSIYHKAAPFIKTTVKMVEDVAKTRGYIRTFLKRRSRLVNKNKAYTMFCRLTQGSAADLMKKGMYESYKAGVFNEIYPHITVHDELDVSVPQTKIAAEAFIETKRIMENCLQIRVPIIADMELGNNWANVEEVIDNNDLYKKLGVNV